MNVRKVLAGSLAAITAGATLALGVFGAGLGDYVATSGNALTSPIIVVGNPQPPGPGFAKDVIGAADIAAAVAGYATTTTTVGGGAVVSVSNGVDLSTANTKLYLKDTNGIKSAKSTLTKSDLPTVLASGSVTDDSGTEYKYDQYINIGDAQVTLGNSGGDLDEPVLYIDAGTTAGDPLYNATVTFSKALNITSSDVQSNTITLFGNEYTIGSGSTATKLVLYGGAQKHTVSEGESATVSVQGTDHTVKVIGVSSTTNAVIEVDGVSKEVTEGTQYTISGSKGKVDVYIDAVWYFGKEAQVSSVRLSLGSSKLTLEDNNEVKVGTEDTAISNTEVQTTGNPLSKLYISVAAEDSDSDSIAEGTPFTDPVFGTFKVAFGGMAPALDDSARDTIEIGTSGDKDATIKFTDYRGNEKTITFVHDNDQSTSTVTPILADSSARNYTVIEGGNTLKKDYLLVSQGDFSHILRVKTLSSIGSTNGKVEFEDVMDGSTITVNMESPGYTNATFYLDGQAYYVDASGTSLNVTWGNGAGPSVVGNETTVFPLIGGKNGELITFMKNLTLTTSATPTWFELPGGSSGMTPVYMNSTGVNGVGTGTATAGQITWGFSGATITNITVGDASVIDLSDGYPAVLVLEEKGKDTSNNEVRDAIVVDTDTEGTSTVKLAVSTSVAVGGLDSGFTTSTADSDISKAVDRYGVGITTDSSDQNKVTLTYPDDQAYVNVAIGSNPTFSVSGTAATVETAVKITSPVAKLADEVDTSTLNADVILVGGPCANSLVAELAAAGHLSTCDEWSYTTGVIKEIDDAFVTGKKALVVAGTTADDTRSLAAQVMQGTTSFEA